MREVVAVRCLFFFFLLFLTLMRNAAGPQTAKLVSRRFGASPFWPNPKQSCCALLRNAGRPPCGCGTGGSRRYVKRQNPLHQFTRSKSATSRLQVGEGKSALCLLCRVFSQILLQRLAANLLRTCWRHVKIVCRVANKSATSWQLPPSLGKRV